MSFWNEWRVPGFAGFIFSMVGVGGNKISVLYPQSQLSARSKTIEHCTYIRSKTGCIRKRNPRHKIRIGKKPLIPESKTFTIVIIMGKFTIVDYPVPEWRSGYAVDCRSITRFESGLWLLSGFIRTAVFERSYLCVPIPPQPAETTRLHPRHRAGCPDLQENEYSCHF